MNLYILRHAIAVEHGAEHAANDSERPLTREGMRKLKLVVQAMKRLELSFDSIFSSPYVRALQTAQIVARGLNQEKRLQLEDCLKPGSNFRELIEKLQRRKAANL